MTTKIPVELSSTPSIVDNGDATAITIDSNENIGIGTASPSNKLHLEISGNNGAYADSDNPLILKNASTTDGATVGQYFGCGNGVGVVLTTHFPNADTNSEGHFAISTRNSSNSLAERMRIDSSGNLLVGKTSTAFGTAGIHQQGSTGRTLCTVNGDNVMDLNRLTSHGVILGFYLNSSSVGYISTNTYSLPSDRNFKRDISDLDLGLNLVTKLKPSQYNYKIDSEDCPKMYGLIAQDLEQALEEEGVEKNSTWLLQHEPKDDVNQSDYALDYQKLTPILIKAIQEQQAIIEDLQTQINEVKNGN